MAELIIFDDGRGCFGPLDDLTPVFALRTGGKCTCDRIERALGQFVSGWWVQPRHIRAWDEQNSRPVNELPAGDRLLCVNGRWSGCGSLPIPGENEAIVTGDGIPLAANLSPDAARLLLDEGQLDSAVTTREVASLPVYNFAWDLLNWLSETIADDLEAQPFSANAADRAECAGEHPVSIDASSVVYPGVVFDTHSGPIFVGPEVTIRPNAVLVGPCWVDRGSVVSEGAVIRGSTVIGPHCRVGGEVGATIFQGYGNKVHDGYLGDSLVGRWVNLGADTVTSNLLNTYTEVPMRLEPDGPRRRSGRMFLGAIIGDHVKTAIGTRLITGTVLGTGAMIALSTPPPPTVSRFGWLTDAGTTRYRIEKFIETARTVMDRRGQSLSEAEVSMLRTLHAASADD